MLKKQPNPRRTPSIQRLKDKDDTGKQRPVLSQRLVSKRAAVIDLGTNNCRLLIAEKKTFHPKGQKGDEFRIIDSFSRIVRLGEGLSKSGKLNSDAMDRTIAALKICAHKIQKSGAQHVRAVATQACRQALNGTEFLHRVKAETSITLTIINTMQEVKLGIASSLPLLKRRWPFSLIFDVGGGSTEVSFLKFQLGKGFGLVDAVSIPVGVVSLADDYGAHGQDLTHSAYQAMCQLMIDKVQGFAQKHHIPHFQSYNQVQNVGMSGTVTTVKALDLGLDVYERQRVDRTLFDMVRLPKIRDDLLEGGQDYVSSHGCIGPDRIDLVLPGIAILDGLGQTFGFRRLLVLDRGIREGLLHQIFTKKRRRRPRSQSVKADS